MQVNGIKIEQCEREISENAREIEQLESELMSPDCNQEGIEERVARLKADCATLQRELIALQSTNGF